jgi:hypothetical protein
MPAIFDKCVRDLMADPKFTPKDPNQTKKDAAYAVCTAQYKKNHGGTSPQAAVDSAVTKKEGDGEHPASHYLVVEDPKSPSTWHLRVKDVNGKPDHTLMGAAWAALHGGYRGNKYSGPNTGEAISRLKALYKSENMTPPGQASIQDIENMSLAQLMEIDPELKLVVLMLDHDRGIRKLNGQY